MVDIGDILRAIAEQRPVFHSEADFQHAFAWEIHRRLPNAAIRLERPVPRLGRTIYADLWVEYNGSRLFVELKYKTRRLALQIGDEPYFLAHHSAHPPNRYSIIKDIERLEYMTRREQLSVGYVVMLTNDSAYWTAARVGEQIDAQFRIHEGRTLHGTLSWGPGTAPGTKRDREEPLNIEGTYIMCWHDYSRPSAGPGGQFRYLSIRVAS